MFNVLQVYLVASYYMAMQCIIPVYCIALNCIAMRVIVIALYCIAFCKVSSQPCIRAVQRNIFQRLVVTHLSKGALFSILSA